MDDLDQQGRRRRTLVMAFACGVMVANIYLCQPLLPEIARSFGVAEGRASLVASLTQVGYGLGMILITPLVDVISPPRLVRSLLAATAASLAAAAFAPSLPLLAFFSLTLAATTVVPQVLISLAPTLASPEERGRVIGTLMTGLVLGILLSRTVAGLVTQATGTWRATYLLAAVTTALLLAVLPRRLPAATGRPHIRYPALMASLPGFLRREPLLRSIGVNVFAFAAFSAVWSTLAFHLKAAPMSLDTAAIGLFGLWGAAGALIAPRAGRLSDRWGSTPVNVIGVLGSLTALALCATLGRTSPLAIAVAMNFLDFGQQSGQVANQARFLRTAGPESGRLNTLYMTATFMGGALGSWLGGLAFAAYGWPGVCTFGFACLAGVALVLAIPARRRA